MKSMPLLETQGRGAQSDAATALGRRQRRKATMRRSSVRRQSLAFAAAYWSRFAHAHKNSNTTNPVVEDFVSCKGTRTPVFAVRGRGRGPLDAVSSGLSAI